MFRVYSRVPLPMQGVKGPGPLVYSTHVLLLTLLQIHVIHMLFCICINMYINNIIVFFCFFFVPFL